MRLGLGDSFWACRLPLRAHACWEDLDAVGTASETEDNVVLLYRAGSLIWWSQPLFFPVFSVQFTRARERLFLYVASDRLYCYELDANRQPFRSFSQQLSAPDWGVTHLAAWGDMLFARAGVGSLHVLRVERERLAEAEVLFGRPGEECTGMVQFPLKQGMLGVVLNRSGTAGTAAPGDVADGARMEFRLYKITFAAPFLRRLTEFDIPGLPHSMAICDSSPTGFTLLGAGKRRIYAYRVDVVGDVWEARIFVPLNGCFSSVWGGGGKVYGTLEDALVSVPFSPGEQHDEELQPTRTNLGGVSQLACRASGEPIALGSFGVRPLE